MHFSPILSNRLNLLRSLFVSHLFILFKIFQESLVVSGFKQSHTSRAICCRLEKATDPVRVHHPMIGKMNRLSADQRMNVLLGRVKYPLGQPQEFDSDFSYAWSTAFQGEVIDARSGRPVTG